MAESSSGGRRPIARAGLQTGRQSATVVLVVVDQIGDGVTAVFLREEKLPTTVLFDVVVLHVGVRSAKYKKPIN